MDDSDWSKFTEVRASSYGSSVEFKRWLKRERPDLVVMEHDITPIVGCQIGWSRQDEMAPVLGEKCSKCRGMIEEGSSLWCPKCQASGFDFQLQAQLRLAGVPPPEPRMPEDLQRGGTTCL